MKAILALLVRSLRMEMRSKWALWTRIGILAGMLFMIAVSAQTVSWSLSPGLQLFSSFIMTNAIALLLISCAVFGTAVSEEKEDGTLELLRMSNLSALAILLGKGVARMVTAITFILMQIPFTLLAVSLGGVGLDQVTGAYTVLLAYLCFSAGHALVWSVVFRRNSTAVICTALCQLAILIGGILAHIGSFLSDNQWPDWAVAIVTTFGAYLTQLNPVAALFPVLQTGFRLQMIWIPSALMAVSGVILFLIAWLIFDPCTRSSTQEISKRRSQRRARRAWPQAFAWASFVFGVRGRVGLTLRTVLCATIVGGFMWIADANDDLNADFVGGTCIGVGLLMGCMELLGISCGLIWTEVRAKTLSSILLVPITAGSIIWEKFKGALPGLAPSFTLVFLGILMNEDVWDSFDEGLFWGWMATLFIQFLLICMGVLYASARTRIIPYIWVMIFLAGTVAEWIMLGILTRGDSAFPILSALFALGGIAALLCALPIALEAAGAREN